METHEDLHLAMVTELHSLRADLKRVAAERDEAEHIAIMEGLRADEAKRQLGEAMKALRTIEARAAESASMFRKTLSGKRMAAVFDRVAETARAAALSPEKPE